MIFLKIASIFQTCALPPNALHHGEIVRDNLEDALMQSLEQVVNEFHFPAAENIPENSLQKRYNYYGYGAPRVSRSMGDRLRRYGSVRLT